MNFLFVAFLDTYELAASLPSREGNFKGEGARRILTLRGPRADADPEDDTLFADAALLKRWPEAQNMLEHIRRIGGAELGRVHMEMLLPGCGIPWARDEGAYAERFHRAHLALRTNPGCRMICGGEMLELLPGNLTIITRRLLHSALNAGDTPRVHLVVDFRANTVVSE